MGVLGFHIQLRLDLCGPLPPPASCMRIICFPLFVHPKGKHAYVVCVHVSFAAYRYLCISLHSSCVAVIYQLASVCLCACVLFIVPFLPNVMLELKGPASIHSTAGENKMLHNVKSMNSLWQCCTVWI